MGLLWVGENALVLSSVSVGGGVRIDVVIGQLVTVGLVVMVVMLGAPLGIFWDPVTACLLGFGSIYLLLATHGFRTVRAMPHVYMLMYRKNLPEDFDDVCFEQGAYVAQTAQKHTWSMAWVGSIIAAYQLLALGGTPITESFIRYGLRVCLLPLLYAWLINGLVWKPFERFAEFAYKTGSHTEPTMAWLPRFVHAPKKNPRTPMGKLIYGTTILAVFLIGGMLGWSITVLSGVSSSAGSGPSPAVEVASQE